MMNDKNTGTKTGMRVLLGAALVWALLGMVSCTPATDSKTTNPFVGTWVDQVSATHTYKYVYNSDMSFEYTDKDGSTLIGHYKGTYSYTAPSTYSEHVAQQDNGAGFVAADWNTPYTYTISGSTLTLDDSKGYKPSFTKQ